MGICGNESFEVECRRVSDVARDENPSSPCASENASPRDIEVEPGSDAAGGGRRIWRAYQQRGAVVATLETKAIALRWKRLGLMGLYEGWHSGRPPK